VSPRDILIPDSQYPQSTRFKHLLPLGIGRSLLRVEMDFSINLDHQRELATEEIEDEPSVGELTLELETEESVGADDLPRFPLCWGRTGSKALRECP